MVPRAVQDAGYTAVGLGVLALQQVQTGRRAVTRKAQAVLTEAKAKASPVTRQLERLPRLPVPGIGPLVEQGKGRLVQALR
jgi:hypothetical protein